MSKIDELDSAQIFDLAQECVKVLLRLAGLSGAEITATPEVDGAPVGFIGVCSDPEKAARYAEAWLAVEIDDEEADYE